jgi:signal transduction histidine kinase
MNTESTGIGLNVVERVVEKMNRRIFITSTEGLGTEVSFTLPKIFKFL